MKQEASGTVLELLLEEAAGEAGVRRRESSVAVGTLSGFDEQGRPLVVLADAAPESVLTARSILVLDQNHVGRQVVLAFEGMDRRQPIVMGVVQEPGETTPQTGSNAGLPGLEADLDGETLVLTAKREIVLRCGKASITLTRAGKVLIRGAYLLSRSSGVNRIKGGSVQIN
jgi:hypothetical protein